MNSSLPFQLRWQRLFRHRADRLFVVPLDHSVTDGPVALDGLDRLLGDIAGTGVDAVVLHKGALRHVSPRHFQEMALILHLSASTGLAPDPNDKRLVATVDEAVRLGADAVSVHVNLGCADEARQLGDLAAVAADCDRWQVPLLVMIYPRGPHIPDPHDPVLIERAVTVAVDLGADVVKTYAPRHPADLARITGRCPVPVIVAGGAYDGDEGALLGRVGDALQGGASGVAIGRAIFQAAEPAAATRKIADLVHGRQELVTGAHS